LGLGVLEAAAGTSTRGTATPTDICLLIELRPRGGAFRPRKRSLSWRFEGLGCGKRSFGDEIEGLANENNGFGSENEAWAATNLRVCAGFLASFRRCASGV